MKILIIHPEDRTTDFLKTCYAGSIENKVVVNKAKTRHQISELIESHDRLIMMGHGSQHGLFAVSQFPVNGNYIIDETMIDLLGAKKENVYIWCNADSFVRRHHLKGFFTGMFISEEAEACYCGLPQINQDAVDESNYEFCRILAKYIQEPGKDIYTNIKREYGATAEKNPIAKYNHHRLYFN